MLRAAIKKTELSLTDTGRDILASYLGGGIWWAYLSHDSHMEQLANDNTDNLCLLP